MNRRLITRKYYTDSVIAQNTNVTIQPHCTRTCFLFFFLPPLPPPPSLSAASAAPAGSVLAPDAEPPPQLNPVSRTPLISLRTAPLPYPNIVVVGLGAVGSAGKASSAEVPFPRLPPPLVLLVPEPGSSAEGRGVEPPPLVPPIQDGWEGREEPDAPGKAGNAEDDDGAGRLGAQSDELAALLAPIDMTLPELCLRVLFLSFSTRVVCLACAAAVFPAFCTVVGLAAAAAAQPLDDVVAPCMPPSPGSEG